MILPPSDENIAKAAALLQNGGIVAFPTETVYGLGCDATNEDTVRKVFELKGRPSNNPLIVHFSNTRAVEKFVTIAPDVRASFDAISTFWPGPISVVLPRKGIVAPSVAANLPTVAVRVPSNPIANKLLEIADIPVAAPSANRSNYVSATTAVHVHEAFGDSVPLILDGGPSSIGIESTVISLVESKPRILRHGAITAEKLAETLNVDLKVLLRSNPNDVAIPQSPGQLPVHYAPTTPLRFVDEPLPKELPKKIGLISFVSTHDRSFDLHYSYVHKLSDKGDLNEIAYGLFSALRYMDSLGLDLILIDRCNDAGLGRAILDRVSRATIGTK